MTHYDFIEIGTSDFDTYIQDKKYINCKGLSIEPVKYYLNKLPNRKISLKLIVQFQIIRDIVLFIMYLKKKLSNII